MKRLDPRARLAGTLVTVLFTLAIAAPRAHAVTDNCSAKPDGTPCATPCQAGGACFHGICTGGVILPDGTPCITGDACTINDKCKNGMCNPGGVRDCLPGPCETAICDTVRGCLYTNVCGGDMWGRDMRLDGGGRDLQSDLSVPDLARPPDATASPRDATVPDSASCGAACDASTDTDAGTLDLAGGDLRGVVGSVHGSGCTCDVGSDPPGAPRLAGALAFALLALLRHRRQRDRRR